MDLYEVFTFFLGLSSRSTDPSSPSSSSSVSLSASGSSAIYNSRVKDGAGYHFFGLHFLLYQGSIERLWGIHPPQGRDQTARWDVRYDTLRAFRPYIVWITCVLEIVEKTAGFYDIFKVVLLF